MKLLAILRWEIATHPVSLVLWQAGTAEAAQGRSPAKFESTLRDRAGNPDGGQQHRADRPPFSRLPSNRADLECYSRAFLVAATPPGAAVFSRYGLTRRSVDAGELDIKLAALGDRVGALGLARSLLEAARRRRPLRTPPRRAVRACGSGLTRSPSWQSASLPDATLGRGPHCQGMEMFFTGCRAEHQVSRRQWVWPSHPAVESWVARGLAARYALSPGDQLPRELLDLLPDE